MARCYSDPVKNRHPSLPRIWLISDARNDARLEVVLARLPRKSGFIFRHYHLPEPMRKARFRQLRRLALRRHHVVILAGSAREARVWNADGAYGPPERLRFPAGILRLGTVHSLRELADAHRAGVDAVLISPIFSTASHPGGRALGGMRFRLIAKRAEVPVIALGGMTAKRARTLGVDAWAAIDGLP